MFISPNPTYRAAEWHASRHRSLPLDSALASCDVIARSTVKLPCTLTPTIPSLVCLKRGYEVAAASVAANAYSKRARPLR